MSPNRQKKLITSALLTTGLLLVILAIWLHAIKAQETSESKLLPPGVYLINIEKSTVVKIPDDLKIIPLNGGIIGRDFKHEKCGGDVKILPELRDDGFIFLECQKCRKTWKRREGEPIK